MRNSVFLMLTTVLTAGCGFAFWVIVARLYPIEEVGRGTSLVASVAFLSYFSLAGLGNSLIRHIPTSRNPAELVGSSIIAVGLAGATVSIAFGLATPLISPELAFLIDTPMNFAVFVLLSAVSAVNLLTDSVFVAFRAARYNFLIKGVLMGLTRLALPLLFVSGGAMGVFASSTLAAGVAALVSIVVMRHGMRLALQLRISFSALRGTLRYSLWTYASSCLNLAPQLIIPIVVINELGSAAAAAYFIAFQIANLVSAVSYAVGESLFAEASHDESEFGRLARHSLVVIASVTGLAVAIVIALAGWVLRAFGPEYATSAYMPLIVLALSSLAVGFNTWANVLVKVRGRLGWLLSANVAFSVVTPVLVVIGTNYGPSGVGVAWGVGNLVCGCVAAGALLTTSRQMAGGLSRSM